MSVFSILNSCEVQKGKVVISGHWSFVIKQNESLNELATLSVFYLQYLTMTEPTTEESKGTFIRLMYEVSMGNFSPSVKVPAKTELE